MKALSTEPISFPEEPVGVGARWTSVTVTPATELATTSVTEVATIITAIDGPLVTSRATSTATSESGPVIYPGLPPDASVELIAAWGSNSGTWTIDLLGLRMRSASTGSGTSEMLVRVSGQTLPMTITTGTRLTVVAE